MPTSSARRRSRVSPVHSQNVVRLAGKLAAPPELRVLPSGDEVVVFRLVVARRAARGRRATVDTIDCTAWTAALRRRISTWQAGDLLEVEGALRRRFWRSAQGPRSRYDVEVVKAERQ